MDKLKQKLYSHPYFDTWQRWEYKHTTLLLLGLIFFLLILDTSFVVATNDLLVGLGYAGAFIAGVMSVSFFTAIPALFILTNLTDLNILAVALIAGLGSMIGDYIILKYAEEKVAYELKPIAFKFGIPQTIGYLQGKKSTLGLIRILGALIIASPLPDEIGIGLLGMGKFKSINFLAICYVLNTIGLLIILFAARAL